MSIKRKLLRGISKFTHNNPGLNNPFTQGLSGQIPGGVGPMGFLKYVMGGKRRR